jgi:KaiC/GvpD/RAD55 family RecA-like ATPase
MNKTTTGVPGLDEMLGGGIPEGRSCLLTGGPGTGKTIFGVQFLLEGIKQGTPGLYVSLEENPKHIRENMKSFGWDLKHYEESGQLAFVDASPYQLIAMDEIKVGDIKIGSSKFSFATLKTIISKEVKKMNPGRIVLDSLTSLNLQYDDVFERRRVILQLFQSLDEIGATSIVTSEVPTSNEDLIQVEEFLAQGVIKMTILPDGTRALQIKKMRGINHDLNPRPYRIYEKGLEVFYKDNIIFGDHRYFM